jgi:hypothetical protein
LLLRNCSDRRLNSFKPAISSLDPIWIFAGDLLRRSIAQGENQMMNRFKRSTRMKLAASVAGITLAATTSLHATLLFDGITNLETGASLGYSTGSTPNYWMGDGYGLMTGATDITGFDISPVNGTGNSATGTVFNALKITIDVWGSVNLTGTVNATTPAFSNELASYVLTSTGTFNPGFYYIYGTSNGSAPAITLTTPLIIPSSTVGISFNYQGSTDGGTTFASYNGLSSIIPASAAPTTGNLVLGGTTGGYYRNVNSETNGNFTAGLRSLGLGNQSIGVRVFGDAGAAVPSFWINPSSSSWTTGSNWSTGNVPDTGTDAYFNLSSSGYTVEIPALEGANNIFIEQDKVSFDLDALNSQVSVTRSLTVGLSPTGNASTGSLTLMNSNGQAAQIVQPGSIVIGSNGGTGSLSVTSNIYLYSNNDTEIGAGSNLSVGAFAKFGTATLTIAGTTDAWTGQLDIGTSSLNIRNGSIGTVINQLKSGLGHGSWTGQGIVSSAAHADTSHLTAVGAILNNNGSGGQIYGSGTALGLFDGDNPATTSVLLRYTYFGDANLDGQVDGSDYTRIDNGFLLQLTGWYNGDFNYDGVVNGSDYTLIDNAFNMQGPNLVTTPGATPGALGSQGVTAADVAAFNQGLDTASLTGGYTAFPLAADPSVTLTAQIAPTEVPEPTSAGLILLAGVSMLGRRSRRSERQI